MVHPIDLGPAAARVADVANHVTDDRLGDPTPNPGWTVGQLLAHVAGLSLAFTAAAQKDLGPYTDTDPSAGEAPTLEPGWRTTLPERLDRLVEAWRNPAAWDGMTRAGGVDLPGGVAGLVALNELVLHGWDLAVATGQEYRCSDPDAQALLEFADDFDPAGTPGMFGPALDVDDDAPAFHRVLARTGRDPGSQRG